MAITPRRLNQSSLEYTSADDFDMDNDYLAVGSAANSGKLAKVAPRRLAEKLNQRTTIVHLEDWDDFDNTGTNDNGAIINEAITEGGSGATISCPSGEVIVGEKLNLLGGTRFIGSGRGRAGTVLIPSGAIDKLFELDSQTLAAYCEGNQLSSFRVRSATGATLSRIFSMIPDSTYVTTELVLSDLYIDTTDTPCSDSAIYLENVVGGVLDNISFRGDCVDAHIEFGSGDVTHSLGNNAVECRKIYSGGNNTATPIGIKALGTSTAVHTGLQFNGCTLQNHTTAGIDLRFVQGCDITGYYSEVNTRALIAGDWGTLKYVRGLTINGGRVWSNDAGDKGFLFDYAEHVTFNNVRMQELLNDNWIEYGRVNGLLVNMFGQTGDAIHDRIRYNANSDVSTAVTIIGAGNRDASILVNEAPSITLMTTDLGAATARKHYKMQVDNTGAWVATSWVPTVA